MFVLEEWTLVSLIIIVSLRLDDNILLWSDDDYGLRDAEKM